MTRFVVGSALGLVALFGVSRWVVGGRDAGAETPIRATLDDSQVLAGTITTEALQLQGGLGALAIPLDDVGEIEPVEGGTLGAAHGNVRVWLRNGSEFVGKWSEPELAMGIAAGGQTVAVDVPVDHLATLQTPDGAVWPDSVVYRVRTSHGDDFLVDAASSRIVIVNGLGTFAPFLSECVSARPIGDPDGEWRVEMASGTVIVGKLDKDAITFRLAMGPDEVTVPVDLFVSMERQEWGAKEQYAPATAVPDALVGSAATPEAGPPRETPADLRDESRPRYFDASSFASAKAAH